MRCVSGKRRPPASLTRSPHSGDGCRWSRCRTMYWNPRTGRCGSPICFTEKQNHTFKTTMWFPGEEWQCPGCTGFTSQFTRLEFLDGYDARFVIVTQGPIDEALAYKRRGGKKIN